jgi:AcrR family transcriptional regulator
MVNPPDYERTRRLLDAASGLFVRHGYDKTSIADITRAAGVSKGALYLSFANKDALFERLLVRELRDFSAAWLTHVEAHPRAGSLGSMYEALVRALDDSPFMAMIFRRDRGLLGRYLAKPDNLFVRYAAGQPTRHEAIAMLQAVHAVRDDVDPKLVAHIMNMLAHGMFVADELGPGAVAPPLDDVIVAVAAMMDRAYSPPDGGDREAGLRVLRELFEGGRRAFAQIDQQLQAQFEQAKSEDTQP